MYSVEKYNKVSIFIILFATFLFAFTQFLLINAYPTIMREFNVNNSQIQLLTSLFLFTTMILIPFTNYLSDTYKSNHLIIAALFLLILGTFLGCQSFNFYMLLISRIIQGAGYAIILPISQSVLLKIAPNKHQSFILGLLNSVINIAPAIAPPITGIFLAFLNWKIMYWLLLPFEILVVIISIIYLSNTFENKKTKLNKKIVTLYAMGSVFLSLMLLFLDLNIIFSLLSGFISFLIFTVFIFLDRHSEASLINFNLLNFRIIKLPTIALFLVMMLLLSVESILPIFTQSILNYTPIESGFIMTPGTLILIMATFISSKLYDKNQNSNIIIIGVITTAVSLVLFIFIDIHSYMVTTIIVFCLFMFGIGCTITPLTSIAYINLDAAYLFQGSALINTFRQFGLILGVTLFSKAINFISHLSVYHSTTSNLLLGIRISYIAMALILVIVLKLALSLKDLQNKISLSHTNHSHIKL
ncbi:MFS transporter [Staphylococcus succinus]|nr:MFS transporter [Staphylococcus succinus]